MRIATTGTSRPFPMHSWLLAAALFLHLNSAVSGLGAEAVNPLRQAQGRPPDMALFPGDAIPRLQIEAAPEAMEVLRNYHQVWGEARPERVDVKVTVREGAMVYTNVALHLKGSYTFEPIDEKPSLTLNFDKFVPGQRFRGLDKIHLNNSVQDPSFLCEELARELFNAAGVPAPRAGHGRVNLNGRDLGFYVVVEGYNKRFLKRHFASAKGNLYDGGSGGDVTKMLKVDSGDFPDNRSNLVALAAASRDPNLQLRAARVEAMVDRDRFLSLAALEVLLLHWDGYCLGPNNYRLFLDETSGRFVFMPHGLDQILGRGMSIRTSLAPKWDGVVARALFKSPENRASYLARAREIFTNQFQAAMLTRRVDEMAARIRRDGVLNRSELARFDSSVEDLKSRMEQRVEVVWKEIRNPPRPIALEKDQSVPLTGWQLHRSLRSSVSGRRVRADNRDLLEVRVADGKWGAGSFRKTVLLAQGRYEFSGLGRTTETPSSPTNGVILRLSGDQEFPGITNSTSWVEMRHEFEVAGETEEELVCEFRGAKGAGLFDFSSLKLRRLSR